MGATSTEMTLIIVRAVHFLAGVVLFGELLFGVVLANAPPRRGVMIAAALVAAVTALAWLAIVAMVMSGEGFATALQPQVLVPVILDTQFGQASMVRAGLLVLVVGTARRSQRASLVAAAALLAALAWMGHAGAATGGARRAGELAADAAHLLAAGAWLGTLPPLAAALRQPVSAPLALVQRYSRLGVTAVAVIVLTGVVNARFRVGTLDALVHSDYGRILLLKLLFVALMLAFAAFNRWVITPRLRRDARGGAAALRASAFVEVALGVTVIVIVGVLGITPPAAMDMPSMAH